MNLINIINDISIILLITFSVWDISECYPRFQQHIPNGNVVPNPCARQQTWAALGHWNPSRGTSINRNPFGEVCYDFLIIVLDKYVTKLLENINYRDKTKQPYRNKIMQITYSCNKRKTSIILLALKCYLRLQRKVNIYCPTASFYQPMTGRSRIFIW